MKKLINLVAAFTIASAIPMGVISCRQHEPDPAPDNNKIEQVISTITDLIRKKLLELKNNLESQNKVNLYQQFGISDDCFNKATNKDSGCFNTWNQQAINKDDSSGGKDYYKAINKYITDNVIQDIETNYRKNAPADWGYMFRAVGDHFIKVNEDKTSFYKTEFHWQPNDQG